MSETTKKIRPSKPTAEIAETDATDEKEDFSKIFLEGLEARVFISLCQDAPGIQITVTAGHLEDLEDTDEEASEGFDSASSIGIYEFKNLSLSDTLESIIARAMTLMKIDVDKSLMGARKILSNSKIMYGRIEDIKTCIGNIGVGDEDEE